MTTHADVEAALRTVLCPCSIAMGHPLDFVSMGKVEEIEIVGKKVTVTLIENPLCYFVRPIAQAMDDALLQLPEVNEVELQFSEKTLWTADLIKEPTKQ